MTDEKMAGKSGSRPEDGQAGSLRGAIQAHSIRYGLLAALLLIVSGIVFLALMPSRPERPPQAASAAVPVAIEVAIETNVPEIVRYPGIVQAQTAVSLAVEGAGRIVELLADKGENVAAGGLLLRLDSRSQAAAVEQARVNVRESTNDFARLEGLRGTGAVSASDFDSAQARKQRAEIALTEAQVALSKCEVRTPISGVVVDRPVEVGEFVSPGTLAFKVSNVDRVKVVLDLPERDVFVVTNGLRIPFSVESLGEREYTGTVTYVAAAAEPLSNTYRTEILTDNPDLILKAGVIVRARLIRRTIPGAVTVSLGAVIPDKGQYVAFVVEDGVAVRRIVRLAAVVDDRAVISEGVRPGERLVVEGQRLISDGEPVVESADGKR